MHTSFYASNFLAIGVTEHVFPSTGAWILLAVTVVSFLLDSVLFYA